jgi:hypothetical protein
MKEKLIKFGAKGAIDGRYAVVQLLLRTAMDSF